MLTMYTIYDSPADFPGIPFVVRAWVVGGGGQLAASGEPLFADTLERARSCVPPGMHRMERSPDDEPQIVETWI